MGKHINQRLEWDEVIPMATAAYNFFPHTTSKERPFFLMIGHDPLTGLEKLWGDTVRYLAKNGGRLDLTVLQNTYQLAAQNVQKVREKAEGKEPSVPSILYVITQLKPSTPNTRVNIGLSRCLEKLKYCLEMLEVKR